MASVKKESEINAKNMNNHNGAISEEKFAALSIDDDEENVPLPSKKSTGTSGTQDVMTVDGKPFGNSLNMALPKGFILTASKDNDEDYFMNYPKRGHCIIFNHKVFSPTLDLNDRNGTTVDRDAANILFKSLGFEVEVCNDLSTKGVMRILETYAYEKDHSDCDCFVVVFMSHGERGNLFSRDSMFKTDELFTHFTADNCPSLAGKPKMFFIQACRGDNLDEGVRTVQKMDQTDGIELSYKLPVQADFLTCYSTVPGYFSWRNTTNGSWFVQSIVDVFRKRAHVEDVVSMMTCVNRIMILKFESNCPSMPKMHGKKQTSSFVSTLMRKVYLKPKQ